jgi:hypothetical protein
MAQGLLWQLYILSGTGFDHPTSLPPSSRTRSGTFNAGNTPGV